jgi:hypothetical protein
MMTWATGTSREIVSTAVMPSMSGMLMSIMMMPGCNSRAS